MGSNWCGYKVAPQRCPHAPQHWYKQCKCDFLRLSSTVARRWTCMCLHVITMRMITVDIWVLMKDLRRCQSIKLIHTCQRREQKCAIVVMRPSHDSTQLGWWWGCEWQLGPWLSVQYSHDLPRACVYATHTVTQAPISEGSHIKQTLFSYMRRWQREYWRKWQSF